MLVISTLVYLETRAVPPFRFIEFTPLLRKRSQLVQCNGYTGFIIDAPEDLQRLSVSSLRFIEFVPFGRDASQLRQGLCLSQWVSQALAES
jgi:hypothetical protein